MTIVIPDLRVRVFGIRHHGPGSARSVRQGLEEFSPDVVLIEGPSDADPLVMLVASDSMIAGPTMWLPAFRPSIFQSAASTHCLWR